MSDMKEQLFTAIHEKHNLKVTLARHKIKFIAVKIE